MKKLQKMFVFLFLLHKRLLKKYSFLVILAMIPVLTGGMFLAAGEDSGVLHIVLCGEGEEDELTEQVIQELMGQKSVLRYSRVFSAEAACQAVQEGKADAAWIFAEGLGKKAQARVSGRREQKVLVTVVEREDTVFLQLTREKLYSALYPHLSYALFQNYIVKDLAAGEAVSGEELRAEYGVAAVEGGIFRFSYRNAEDQTDTEAETNYLLTPFRGLLALLVLLCGLAGSLYYEQDKAGKVFVSMSVGRRFFFPYLCHLPAVIDGAAVVLLTFFITHIGVSWERELLLMALYCAACIGFSNLFRKICGTTQRLAACIPLLLLAMVVLCPVFISLGQFRMVQHLFPLFYYLQSVHNTGYVRYFLVYIAVVYGADLLVGTGERY